jgi:hypothetical protein
LFSKFGSNADGTLVEDSSMVLEVRGIINVLVRIVKVLVTGMAEMLVP